MRNLQLGLADTGDALVDESAGVGDGIHELLDGRTGSGTVETRLVEPLVGELLAGTSGVEGLSSEVLKVNNLGAVLTEKLGELVVLGLSDLEEGDVVEQKALEIVRREVEELLAGAVQADLLQGANLAVDVKSVSHGSSF